MNYSLAYRIGFHPWEDAEEQPSFTDKFSVLLDREESGRQPPYGSALDATVLLIAWVPRRRGPLPRGVSRREIEAAFLGWDVTDVGEPAFEAPKPIELLTKPEVRWYRLLRK